MKNIADFFILCSGARKEILDQCPTERTKFAGIGSIIFLTAVLAVLSGGYAMFFTFNSVTGAIAFGLLWGVIIFCIDRYIVSSIKKTGKIKSELGMAAPRFFMAAVLAITISKPIEVKLFDGSISKQMGAEGEVSDKRCEDEFNATRGVLEKNEADLRGKLQKDKNDLYDKDAVYTGISNQKKSLEDKDTRLNSEIQGNMPVIRANTYREEVFNKEKNKVETIWHYNAIAREKTAENKRFRGEITDDRPVIKDLNDQLITRKGELADLVKNTEKQYGDQIDGVQHHITQLDADRQTIITTCQSQAKMDKDILGRLRALGTIKEGNSTVRWASWLITLLFLLIESAPITVKLLAKRGPYDEILEKTEQVIVLEQQRLVYEKASELEKFAEEVDALSKLKIGMQVKAETDRIQAEMKANDALLADISEKVSQLAKMETEKWYKEEVEKRTGKPADPTLSAEQGNGKDHS